MNHKYNLIEKKIRAEVIYDHLIKAELPLKCICFTSGNSAKYLHKVGIQVIGVGEGQVLNTDRWWTFTEIARLGLFDATSGHLPMPLMVEIAKRLKKQIKKIPKKIALPTGSGETLVCMALAFPDTIIKAVYNIDSHTKWNKDAPLNDLVKLLSSKRGKSDR